MLAKAKGEGKGEAKGDAKVKIRTKLTFCLKLTSKGSKC
jgi:hypothetical protein